MAKRKVKIGAEEFAVRAHIAGKTYAQAQMEETAALMKPIRAPREGYTKIKDRIKNETGK